MIDIGKDLQDAFNDGYKQAMQDRWIPVIEKLPIQEDGRGIWVLTCATSGLVESNHFCNGRFYDADKNGYKIVAWQPLPEPYNSCGNGSAMRDFSYY